MLCSWSICSIFGFYERLRDALREASRNDHRNINVSHAPFHARSLALETAVCSGTFILFKILGYIIVAVYSLIDPSLSRSPDNRFGPPRPPVAILSPPCRLPVAVSALSAPCRSPVACLSLPCRCPAAPLSLPCRFPVAFLPPSCRYPVASCRFLSFPVAMLLFAWRLPVALLSLSCRSLLSLSCRYFVLPPCRPPVGTKLRV